MRSSIKGVKLWNSSDEESRFFHEEKYFLFFLFIKLLTVVIIAVVRSGGRVLFKNQRQPQTFTFSPHRWKHISPPAEFGAKHSVCVVEPWFSPAGTFSPPAAAQVVSMCKMCPEAAGEPADTPWASDTHSHTHTHYDPSHTPCLLTHRVTPSLSVLLCQHTLTHTHI